MVTSVGHVWFNTFFEGQGPEKYLAARKAHGASASREASADEVPGAPWADASGVFEINFEDVDGIKGGKRKGTVAFDKIAVVWRVAAVVPAEKTIQAEYAAGSATQEHRGRPRAPSVVINEPGPNEAVIGGQAANWHGEASHTAEHGDQALATRETGGVSLGSKLESRDEEVVDDGSDEDGVDGIMRGVR
jgi:protein-tyrosine phosphatase